MNPSLTYQIAQSHQTDLRRDADNARVARQSRTAGPSRWHRLAHLTIGRTAALREQQSVLRARHLGA